MSVRIIKISNMELQLPEQEHTDDDDKVHASAVAKLRTGGQLTEEEKTALTSRLRNLRDNGNCQGC